MQTLSLETHPSAKAPVRKQGSAHATLPGSMLPAVYPGKTTHSSPVAAQGAYVPDAAPYTDLDSMLSQDPNTGAVHGVRIALLFNAGLALSGLLAWELWTLLAG